MPDFCAYFNANICRSCELLPVDYSQQIRNKEAVLLKALDSRIALLPSVTSKETGFRNKAKLVVSGTLEKPLIGLIDKEILECPVHDPAINRLLIDLVPFIQEAKLIPYNISERKGELKGLIVFHGTEMYLRFVLRSKEPLDRIKKHLPRLMSKYPELASVSVNIQPIHSAILEGDEEVSLSARDHIIHEINGMKLKLRPRAFVQTNQEVAGKLYSTAASWVKELKVKKFLELFSGQGAFSFHCAPFVQEARGVEINQDAVMVANEAAKEFKLDHLKFVSLDAGKSSEIVKEFSPDLILVNPPRRGLSESISVLKNQKPEWIIYSSCSVESLATDLQGLSEYKIERAQLFDMFPHTSHFETLVLLKLQR
jgi:23S rRNA (uracil747-C5)-methyltransferase